MSKSMTECILHSFIVLVAALTAVACDGTYQVLLTRDSIKAKSCSENLLTVRLEERKVDGETWVSNGSVRVAPPSKYISVESWATGGRPEQFRFTITCPSSGMVMYDSGTVQASGQIFICSRFYLVTLLDSERGMTQQQLCEYLRQERTGDEIAETEYSSPNR